MSSQISYILQRTSWLKQVKQAFSINPVVAILGPRQCGKTTLAKQYVAKKSDFNTLNYFDLEDEDDIARLSYPKLTLSSLRGLIVIDEIQRIRELFPTIRTLVDNHELQQQYLILGSASRDLIQESSESLAGRISHIELTPFNLNEIDNAKHLWVRGGFPDAYLAPSEKQCFLWLKSFIRTFLERDIPNLGIKIPPQHLRRFWQMLAHYHGSIYNASEIGRSLQRSNKTIAHYTDILVGTYMIRQLRPWHENISKRQIKSPKIYFRDAGIFHSLLGINSYQALHKHPKLGASWEGFALEEVIRYHQAEPEDCYFWGIHSQTELDLLIHRNERRFGFEFKFTDAPKLTHSMRLSLDYLKLDQLTVIYPGEKSYPLAENIHVKGLEAYCHDGNSN